MKNILLILIFSLISLPIYADEIPKGINNIDFDGDGSQEVIVKAWVSVKSDHTGYYALTIYKIDQNKDLFLIPIMKQPLVSTMQSPVISQNLEEMQNPECVVWNWNIFKSGNKNALISAHRDFGQEWLDENVVTFDVYFLKPNVGNAQGFSDLIFEKEKTFKSKSKYCDVRKAFEQEFQILFNE